jgi:hypothetical protein
VVIKTKLLSCKAITLDSVSLVLLKSHKDLLPEILQECRWVEGIARAELKVMKVLGFFLEDKKHIGTCIKSTLKHTLPFKSVVVWCGVEGL